MQISLAHGSDQGAPGSYIVVPEGVSAGDEKGTRMVQTDWDLPGLASTFGWAVASVRSNHGGYNPTEDDCEHSGTDGTVPCKTCGMPVDAFMTSATAFLDNCVEQGTKVEDPGYFEEH